jgi:hypothetical protein
MASLVLACGSQSPTASASPTELAATEGPGEHPAASGPMPLLASATIDEPLPEVFGGSMASAVVAFKGSLLAFGGINGGCCDGSFSADTRAVTWTSSDGRAWSLEAPRPELALGHVTAAAASEERLVVIGERLLESQVEVGSIDRRSAVWTSGDGRQWELVTDVPAFTTITATAAGFIAASNANAFPELWWSETGSAWARIAGRAELGQGRIDRLLTTPIGVFGVGASLNAEADGQPSNAGDPAAAVWRSIDGGSWTRVADGAMFSGAPMRDAAWSDGQLLAVGSGGTPIRPTVWTSTDGDAWERIASPLLAEGHATDAAGAISLRATHVIGLRTGFAVSGTWTDVDGAASSGTVVWATRDGLAWGQVTAMGTAPEINDWLLTGDAQIGAVGWGPVPGRMVPLAWTIAIP